MLYYNNKYGTTITALLILKLSLHFKVLPFKIITLTIFFFRDGEISERLCPDGMVFNDYSPQDEKCDLPFNIDCSHRSKLRKYTIKY